jgi:hypothetical protein
LGSPERRILSKRSQNASKISEDILADNIFPGAKFYADPKLTHKILGIFCKTHTNPSKRPAEKERELIVFFSFLLISVFFSLLFSFLSSLFLLLLQGNPRDRERLRERKRARERDYLLLIFFF